MNLDEKKLTKIITNVPSTGNNCGLYALVLAIKLAESKEIKMLLPDYINTISQDSLRKMDIHTEVIGKKLRNILVHTLIKDTDYKNEAKQPFLDLCLKYVLNRGCPPEMEAWWRSNVKLLEQLKSEIKAIIAIDAKGQTINLEKLANEKKIPKITIDNGYNTLKTLMNQQNPNNNTEKIKNFFGMFDSKQESDDIVKLIRLRKFSRLVWNKISKDDASQATRQIFAKLITTYFEGIYLNILQNPADQPKYLTIFSQLEMLRFSDTDLAILSGSEFDYREYKVFLLCQLKIDQHKYDAMYQNYCDYVNNTTVMLSADELGSLARSWNIQLQVEFRNNLPPYNSHREADPNRLMVTLCNPSRNHWQVVTYSTEPLPENKAIDLLDFSSSSAHSQTQNSDASKLAITNILKILNEMEVFHQRLLSQYPLTEGEKNEVFNLMMRLSWRSKEIIHEKNSLKEIHRNIPWRELDILSEAIVQYRNRIILLPQFYEFLKNDLGNLRGSFSEILTGLPQSSQTEKYYNLKLIVAFIKDKKSITDVLNVLEKFQHDHSSLTLLKKKAIIRALKIIGQSMKQLSYYIKGLVPDPAWYEKALFQDIRDMLEHLDENPKRQKAIDEVLSDDSELLINILEKDFQYIYNKFQVMARHLELLEKHGEITPSIQFYNPLNMLTPLVTPNMINKFSLHNSKKLHYFLYHPSLIDYPLRSMQRKLANLIKQGISGDSINTIKVMFYRLKNNNKLNEGTQKAIENFLKLESARIKAGILEHLKVKIEQEIEQQIIIQMSLLPTYPETSYTQLKSIKEKAASLIKDFTNFSTPRKLKKNLIHLIEICRQHPENFNLEITNNLSSLEIKFDETIRVEFNNDIARANEKLQSLFDNLNDQRIPIKILIKILEIINSPSLLRKKILFKTVKLDILVLLKNPSLDFITKLIESTELQLIEDQKKFDRIINSHLSIRESKEKEVSILDKIEEQLKHLEDDFESFFENQDIDKFAKAAEAIGSTPRLIEKLKIYYQKFWQKKLEYTSNLKPAILKLVPVDEKIQQNVDNINLSLQQIEHELAKESINIDNIAIQLLSFGVNGNAIISWKKKPANAKKEILKKIEKWRPKPLDELKVAKSNVLNEIDMQHPDITKLRKLSVDLGMDIQLIFKEEKCQALERELALLKRSMHECLIKGKKEVFKRLLFGYAGESSGAQQFFDILADLGITSIEEFVKWGDVLRSIKDKPEPPLFKLIEDFNIELINLAELINEAKGDLQLQSPMLLLAVQDQLETIGKIADILAEQPEYLTVNLDPLAYHKLRVFKIFRNLLAHELQDIDFVTTQKITEEAIFNFMLNFPGIIVNLTKNQPLQKINYPIKPRLELHLRYDYMIDNFEVIKQLASRYGISSTSLKIFGKSLDIDLGPQADLSLLVEFLAEPQMLSLLDFQWELSQLLGCEVTCYTTESLVSFKRYLDETQFLQLVTKSVLLDRFLQIKINRQCFRDNPFTIFEPIIPDGISVDELMEAQSFHPRVLNNESECDQVDKPLFPMIKFQLTLTEEKNISDSFLQDKEDKYDYCRVMAIKTLEFFKLIGLIEALLLYMYQRESRLLDSMQNKNLGFQETLLFDKVSIRFKHAKKTHLKLQKKIVLPDLLNAIEVLESDPASQAKLTNKHITLIIVILADYIFLKKYGLLQQLQQSVKKSQSSSKDTDLFTKAYFQALIEQTNWYEDQPKNAMGELQNPTEEAKSKLEKFNILNRSFAEYEAQNEDRLSYLSTLDEMETHRQSVDDEYKRLLNLAPDLNKPVFQTKALAIKRYLQKIYTSSANIHNKIFDFDSHEDDYQLLWKIFPCDEFIIDCLAEFQKIEVVYHSEENAYAKNLLLLFFEGAIQAFRREDGNRHDAIIQLLINQVNNIKNQSKLIWIQAAKNTFLSFIATEIIGKDKSRAYYDKFEDHMDSQLAHFIFLVLVAEDRLNMEIVKLKALPSLSELDIKPILNFFQDFHGNMSEWLIPFLKSKNLFMYFQVLRQRDVYLLFQEILKDYMDSFEEELIIQNPVTIKFLQEILNIIKALGFSHLKIYQVLINQMLQLQPGKQFIFFSIAYSFIGDLKIYELIKYLEKILVSELALDRELAQNSGEPLSPLSLAFRAPLNPSTLGHATSFVMPPRIPMVPKGLTRSKSCSSFFSSSRYVEVNVEQKESLELVHVDVLGIKVTTSK